MANTSNQTLRFVQITASIYDPSHVIIGTATGYSDVDTLGPGERSPFQISSFGSSQTGQIGTYRLSISSQPAFGEQKPALLKLTLSRAYTDSLGTNHVIGEIANEGNNTAHFVKASGTFYNYNHQVIDEGPAYVNDIPPGQTMPFDMLSLDDSEYYLTPVKDVDEGGNTKLGKDRGTIHRTRAELIVRYRTGEDRMKAIFSDTRHLNPSKTEVLNKALGIYRVATESNNELQAIGTYFSCIQAIVRDDIGEPKVRSCHIKKALKSIVGNEEDFGNNFDRYWGKYRSGGTHGRLDLTDRSLVREAKKHVSRLNQWTRKLILDYISRNKSSP